MESVEHIFIILFQPCYNFDFNESWFLNNFRVKSSDFISGEKIQNYLQPCRPDQPLVRQSAPLLSLKGIRHLPMLVTKFFSFILFKPLKRVASNGVHSSLSFST
jgi:hypothetical protein